MGACLVSNDTIKGFLNDHTHLRGKNARLSQAGHTLVIVAIVWREIHLTAYLVMQPAQVIKLSYGYKIKAKKEISVTKSAVLCALFTLILGGEKINQ